jgi:hypothetical protein
VKVEFVPRPGLIVFAFDAFSLAASDLTVEPGPIVGFAKKLLEQRSPVVAQNLAAVAGPSKCWQERVRRR